MRSDCCVLRGNLTEFAQIKQLSKVEYNLSNFVNRHTSKSFARMTRNNEMKKEYNRMIKVVHFVRTALPETIFPSMNLQNDNDEGINLTNLNELDIVSKSNVVLSL